MDELQKSFSAYLLIKGGSEGADGKKYLHGPAALVEEDGLGADFDKDDLTKAAVANGLKTFERLGGQVDWDHLYAKTHRAAHIIGKCVGIQENPAGGAPIVTTELFMNKAMAKEAWEHHESGGVLGYSLQGVAITGIAKGGDPKNGKRITNLDIHMMTITPMPKGFEGPRLSGGQPASLGAMMKGLNAELAAGETDGWEPVEHVEPVDKALMAGDGIVQAGGTGGAALRKQDLAGAKTAKTPCKCGCHGKREKRKRDQKPGTVSAVPMNKALTEELTRHGAANAAGLAQAIVKALSQPPKATVANVVFRHIHGTDGKYNGTVSQRYDGTPEHAKAVSQTLETRAHDQFQYEPHKSSSIQSQTGATDSTGNHKYVIAPNHRHIAEAGTDHAKYIQGNLAAGSRLKQSGLIDQWGDPTPKAHSIGGRKGLGLS